MKKYVLRICEHLLSSANCRKRSNVQDPPPVVRLCESHFRNRSDKPQHSARFARRDAEQQFAVRLALLIDLLPVGNFLPIVQF